MEVFCGEGGGTRMRGARRRAIPHKAKQGGVPELGRRPVGLVHRAQVDALSNLGKALQAKGKGVIFFPLHVMRSH